MEKEQFLKLVQEQFIDYENINLTYETEFKMLDSYDSLTGMAIIASIEDKYNKIIPVESFRNFVTIQDIYNFINY